MEKICISKTFSKRFEVVSFVCLFILSIILLNCGGGGGGTPVQPVDEPVLSSDRDITSFSFTAAANSALSQNVTGTISATNIYVTVPNGTDRTALVATFSTTGQTVRVDGDIQTSGVTANDFRSIVVYVVTAENASTRNYTVTVSEAPASTDAIIADHLAATAFSSIPSAAIAQAKSTLRIAYGHTSHGSQLVTGMAALASADSLYAYNSTGSSGALLLRDTPFSGASDLGNPNRTAWEAATRTFLNSNPTINVIIWSWCGQVSSASESDITTYLTLMNQLEQDYPSVKFVYMTGHLDGGGTAGNLHLRNQQIRNYCRLNNKVLYDFADIESYDPDGLTNYMVLRANDNCDYDNDNNGTRELNWATDWVAANSSHPLTTLATNCSSCVHSQRLNCVLKGRAVWWLWARLAGWTP